MTVVPSEFSEQHGIFFSSLNETKVSMARKCYNHRSHRALQGSDTEHRHQHNSDYTVKPVQSGCFQKDQKMVFKTKYSFGKSKLLLDAPFGAFCNTFDLH